MLDILLIVALMFTIGFAMRKHDPEYKVGNGLGDFLGWFFASLFLLALVRLPIYLAVYGFVFPFRPSNTCQIVSGIAAITFWGAMIYWRIPARLLGRK